MKKQISKRRTSNFQTQSLEKRKILTHFLTNKTNNIKWLKYSSNKLNYLIRIGMSACLEAEDFVSRAKLIILEIVTVTHAFTEDPKFNITKDGKTVSMSRNQLNFYFYQLMKWDLSHTFRKDQKTIPLPHWDEDDYGEINPEDDILLYRKKQDNDFIMPVYDPFEESERLNFEEFIDECGDYLESKDPLLRKVFEERVNGTPNRLIARKYDITIRKVESIRKKISRKLNNGLMQEGVRSKE